MRHLFYRRRFPRIELGWPAWVACKVVARDMLVAQKLYQAASAPSTAYKNRNEPPKILSFSSLEPYRLFFNVHSYLHERDTCDIMKQLEIVTFHPEDESDLDLNAGLSLEYVNYQPFSNLKIFLFSIVLTDFTWQHYSRSWLEWKPVKYMDGTKVAEAVASRLPTERLEGSQGHDFWI